MRSTTGVVVLNYGDPADTFACLDSLERSDDLDLRIVVVDNGPEDDAHDALVTGVGGRAAVVATGSNLGYAAGNNIGLARLGESDCERFWILNPDTRVEHDTLTRLRGLLEAVPDCAVVGPRIVFPGPEQRIWFDGGRVDRETGTTRHMHQNRRAEKFAPLAIDVDYVTGASMLIRRTALEDVGPIPEDYFLYYEETEWCLRAAQRGWRVMVEQSARMVHHKRSGETLPKPYHLYYMTRNRYVFAARALGIDGEVALEVMGETFLANWRAKVAERAPAWLGHFDDLVARAHADAREGRLGRNDEITSYPTAEEVA